MLVSRLRLPVKTSARSICFAAWLRTLDRWAERDESIWPRLILENTEGSAMTLTELVVDVMDRLKSRGICFALCDFGSGYTALSCF